MSRSAFPGTFLVLEGDSDSKFFTRRINRDQCQIVIAGGKDTVCGSVISFYGNGQRGVIGVIDDDYDSLCGVACPSPHLIRTETRDLEGIMLRSAALEAVLHELGDPAKIRAFEVSAARPVRQALVDRAMLFAKLRLLDKRQAWKFQFDTLSPWRFADVGTWSIDEHAVIAFVASKVGLRAEELQNLLAQLDVPEPFAVLHGKDMATILSIGLRSKLGNNQHPVERICLMLRLAFDDAMAAASLLFRQIKLWEGANAPYMVLAR